MKKSLLTCALAGLCVLGAAAPARAQAPTKQVVGYIMARGQVLDGATIAAGKMTRINYAFLRPQNGVVVASPNDAANFAVLTSLKRRNPALQVLVSVGGGSGSADFSDLALTPASRTKFIDSVVAVIEKYQLDGVDVDWEYPGYGHGGVHARPVDTQDYTLLLKGLRLRFNQLQPKLGRHLVITSATGATTIWLAHTHMRQASRWLDSVNMMCYDWYNALATTTGHDSPLYTNPADPKAISIDHSVKMYLAAGVPAAKLVIGVPFYGRLWTGVAAGQTHGLWQPVTTRTSPPNTTLDFWQIAALLDAPGYTRYWDPVAMTPYLYNAATQTLVTYNDAEAERARAQYVDEHHLGGLMFWQYTGDPQNVLLDAIDQGLEAGTAVRAQR